MKKNTIKKRKIRKDCWNLDVSFIIWLHERLPVFLHDAGNWIDLENHTFEFEGRTWTQLELINELMKDVNYCRHGDGWEKEYEEHRKRLCQIWALIMPAMWW